MLSNKKINLLMGFMFVALIGLVFGLFSQTLGLNLNSTLQDNSQQGYRNPVLPGSGGNGPGLALVPGNSGGGPKLAFGAGGDRPNRAEAPSFAEQRSMIFMGLGGGGPRLAFGTEIGNPKLAFSAGAGGPKLAFGAGTDRPIKAVAPPFAEQSSMMFMQGGGGGPRLAFGTGVGNPKLAV